MIPLRGALIAPLWSAKSGRGCEWGVSRFLRSERRRGSMSKQHLQAVHVGTSCRALIIWESNPDVNSMPIHVGKSMKYSIRRLGFRYHGVLSSSARRVRMGSDLPVSPAVAGAMVVALGPSRF